MKRLKNPTNSPLAGTPKLILQYFIVLSIHFLAVFFIRPFQLVSQIGWLDPWTSMGFGQVFPATPYPWHYYKESRFFSILYQRLLTHVSSSMYLIVQTLVVSICGTLVYHFLRKFSPNHFLVLGASLLVSTSYLLWGDSAGGADYYNTLGNILIIFVLIIIFRIIRSNHSDLFLKRYWLFLGGMSYITLIEAPSGIIVVFCFQLSLILWLWGKSDFQFRKNFNYLKRILFLQMVGVSSIFIFECFVLLLLGQSPLRLLSGPKFLFDSIVNSKTQENWWRPLGLNDFLKTDYLLAFSFLGLTGIAISLGLFFYFKKKQFEALAIHRYNFIKNCIISYSITWMILLILQFAGKSVALTLGYFTTPFLFTGLTLFLASLLFLSSFQQKVFFIQSWILVVTITILSAFPLMNPVRPSFNMTTDFRECEKIRLEFRESALSLAEEIDRKYGPRGSLLMGADDSVFEKKIESKCSSINGRPVSESLMSVSQLGFPGVSILGQIKSPGMFSDYPRQYLAKPFDREVKPLNCVLVWHTSDQAKSGDTLYLEVGNDTLGIQKICQ